jgi:hypothetical protein
VSPGAGFLCSHLLFLRLTSRRCASAASQLAVFRTWPHLSFAVLACVCSAVGGPCAHDARAHSDARGRQVARQRFVSGLYSSPRSILLACVLCLRVGFAIPLRSLRLCEFEPGTNSVRAGCQASPYSNCGGGPGTPLLSPISDAGEQEEMLTPLSAGTRTPFCCDRAVCVQSRCVDGRFRLGFFCRLLSSRFLAVVTISSCVPLCGSKRRLIVPVRAAASAGPGDEDSFRGRRPSAIVTAGPGNGFS